MLPLIGGWILLIIIIIIFWICMAPIYNKIGTVIDKKLKLFTNKEENVKDE
jgi:F0F1-type ATP synthase membrane subunit b/b'